jgi:glycosyltransferase involved in cell wall biosynthesis
LCLEQPTLTIGIPTYNGEKYLSQTLDSILRQISDVTPGSVEIIISNNCSTDHTLEIATTYYQKWPDIVAIYSNESNVGFDANVDLTVRRARSNYVWLLSDDDYLLEGSLVDVVDVAIEKTNLAFMFVNYEHLVGLTLLQDTYCENGNQFFETTKYKCGLISSCIINRQLWIELFMERYIGCLWIHVAYCLKALSPTEYRGSYIFARYMVKLDGEPRWGGDGGFIDTGLHFVDLLEGMEAAGYSKTVKRIGEMAIRGGYKRLIPLAVSQGLRVDYDLIRRFVRYYHTHLSFWLIDLPLLLVPKTFYCFLLKLRRATKKNYSSCKHI